MKFKEVAHIFSRIEQVSSRLEMTKQLANLLHEATPREAEILCNMTLGMLRPPYKGNNFGLAEKQLAQAVARVLGCPIKDVTTERKRLGDLGSVLEQWSWTITRHRSLEAVYDDLVEIEKISGTGSQEKKIKAVETLLRAMEPQSANYIVRIILGTLRLGFSDMTLIDALSWMEEGDKSLRADLEHAYNISADIGLIAYRLKNDGIKGVRKTTIEVGIPIRPASAERLPTAKAIIEKIGPCIAQPKLDGFRIQIHVKNGKVKFFSRNLQDMSEMFPDLMAACKKIKAKEFIGEGEAIVYDRETGSFLPFQETVKRKRKHGIAEAMSEYPLQVFLFDVLYVDGESFLDKTHKQRRKKLLSLIPAGDLVVHVIDERHIQTSDELEKYFTETITAGLEGLVVKREDSTYQPGKRNFNWIKLKRQEEGHLDDTIDCVILGYYAGHGKRASFGIGAFLVGVYNQKKDQFETVAKIGTGLKDDGWKLLKKKCDALKVSKAPVSVIFPVTLTPDVWVSPELVCLVRADEITKSPIHTAGAAGSDLGFALRFPRFMGYRDDKRAIDATSVDELKTLYRNQFMKKS
ncbi:ATP-dependent DNA ligase [Candidatus Babeliales bacterium]|nr:ATP-dependent DNA ligase [Candidatus Babeliales bacterium]